MYNLKDEFLFLIIKINNTCIILIDPILERQWLYLLDMERIEEVMDCFSLSLYHKLAFMGDAVSIDNQKFRYSLLIK